MTVFPEETELHEGNEAYLDDDNFHEPESDHWWEHETFWFWLCGDADVPGLRQRGDEHRDHADHGNPFASDESGGSSVIVTFLALGLLQCIHVQSQLSSKRGGYFRFEVSLIEEKNSRLSRRR